MSDGEEKSSWNAALGFMEELTLIRRQLHYSRLSNDYDRRYKLLVCYYMALSGVMKTKHMKDGSNKESERQKKQDNAFGMVTNYYNKYQAVLRQKTGQIDSKILNSFDAWEMLLRKDESALGLLVTFNDDPASAIGGKHY